MSPSLNESASDSTNVRVIELDDDVEGEHVDNLTDYFFQKIGEPIPMFKDSSSPVFDLETLPSQGLAVSELFKLTFVAHSSGFYVLRTKDIIDSAVETAKEKGRVTSLQELKFLDVSIGKIHILCLSTDSSTLAVAVGRDIHLFEVNSLLNKELEPLTSCSLEDSSYVKDMRWSNRKESSYVALSNEGMLYHGCLDGSLDNVMDNVDAVDWSVKGRFIAVARNNTLSILSSRFKERLLLSLKSWNGGSVDNCIVKVDTIRWIRVDYIVLGCFQLTADGEEENYFLQVITSKDGRITDASSEPVVLSFYNIFMGLTDDILPYGSGPYLFFTYLEHCELAIATNRKNTEDHIVLLDWSLDGDKREVAFVDNERDKWLPKIQLQENRDDNLIIGLCIDKLSVRGKVIVQLGVEEEKELSPYCVVMCLTLDGKLVMFNFASIAGTKVSSEIVPTLLDEENTEAGVPTETQQSSLIKLSSEKTEGKKDMVPSGGQLMEGSCRKEMYFGKVGVIHTAEQMKSSEKNKGTITGNQEVQAQSMINPGEATSKTSLVEGSTHMGRDSSKIDGPKFSSFGSRNAGKFPAESHNQLNENTLQYHSELGKDLPEKNGLTSLQGAFSQSWSSGKLTPSSVYDTSSQLTPFGGTPVNKSVTIGASVGAAKVHGRQNLQKDVSGKLTSVNFTAKPSESEGTLQIREMAKELDLLLNNIEKEGGFADSCTVFLRNSVHAFEDGIGSLSHKCRMWKNVMEEQVREIQHLSDKTIEVLARKVYIEGTIKQARDSNYRDLWDRQKLSSELEQKRRQILKSNQDITNQLVGLERHFNTLELNEFGTNAATHAGQRAIQSRFRPSRHVQSLQSLHNTMTSQLAAAEQLSECLTKQMAVLRIQSPVKQKNVKKELFDSIGISYDASFSSPDLKKMVDNASMKKSMISSGSFSKDQSRRCQSSGMKSTDSETTRRRRDSLDQCWANFEPPKTTVKRLLLQESQRESASNSPSLLRRHIITPYNQEHSAVTHPNKSTPSTFSYTSGDKGIGGMFSKQGYEKQSTTFKSANDRSEASPSRETSPSNYESGRVLTLSPPQLMHKPVQTLSGSSLNQLEDKSSNGVSKTTKSYFNTVNDYKVELQTETNLTLKALPKKPSEFLHSSSEVTVPKNSLIENMNPLRGTVKSFSFGSGENLDPPNLSHYDVATSKIQSSENSGTFTGFIVGTDTNQNVPLAPSSFSTLFSGFNSLAPSSISVSSTSESQKAELQTSAGMASSKANLEVPAEPHVLSDPLSESTGSVFESQANFKIATTPNNVLSSAQIEQPAANIFPTAPPTVSDGTASRKTENLEVPVTEEDGMEEEAPEVSPTIDLNLSLGTFGGLGNFGLGSTPNPNSLKTNSFGGTFGNSTTNHQIGSSVPMNVPSGELFRPASFTFQPSQPNPAPTNSAFSTGNNSQAPTLGFGQPAQIGAGQQAMGNVLGSFGQSRQLGAGLPGAGFASASSFGSGFASARPTGGGFAGVASTGGGFAGLASGAGGFAGVASAGGGFAAAGASGGGGFGGAASAGGGFAAGGGTGFGAFSNQGTGGFSGFGGSAAGTGGGSAFGGGSGATGKPAELFTQMRR